MFDHRISVSPPEHDQRGVRIVVQDGKNSSTAIDLDTDAAREFAEAIMETFSNQEPATAR